MEYKAETLAMAMSISMATIMSFLPSAQQERFLGEIPEDEKNCEKERGEDLKG